MCINTNVFANINYVTKLTIILNINKFNSKYFTKPCNKISTFVLNKTFII